MSTKSQNITDLNSCLNRAADDEPVFVLRANDPCASFAVHNWTVSYSHSKGGYHRLTPAQQQKFHDAMNVSKAMRDWYRKKVEDDIPF